MSQHDEQQQQQQQQPFLPNGLLGTAYLAAGSGAGAGKRKTVVGAGSAVGIASIAEGLEPNSRNGSMVTGDAGGESR